ncbi:MAG: ATP-binding cassette domain-containing protein [Hominilimicola sp.]
MFEDSSAFFDSGKCYALVGESGRGKSTLTKILLGFYQPKKGCIFIDGSDITELGLVNVRDKIAYIPQEPYLFNCSIKENIRMGKLNASDEEIYNAAKQAEHTISYRSLKTAMKRLRANEEIYFREVRSNE